MSAARDLLHDYPHIIAELHLVTGAGGVFDVVVDGHLLYSKKKAGRHADPGEVLQLFRERYAKDVVVYDGVCPIHDVLRSASVEKVHGQMPQAVVIAHPECRADVLELADEVCSTTGMTAAVARHPEAKTFIVATEHGILTGLQKRYPDKEFVVADGCLGFRMHCPYMKMIDLVMVRDALRRGKHAIEVPPDVAAGARRALERMIAVPRDA